MAKIITKNKAIEKLENYYMKKSKRILAEMVVDHILYTHTDGPLTKLGISEQLADLGLGEFTVIEDSDAAKVLFEKD
jgi:hypothetical protein